jgi:hypothetical protein
MEQIYDNIFETGTGDAEKALRILIDHGMADGELHKQWVIDQAIRALSGAYYQDLITAYNHGGDGPDTYMWDEGIAP